MRQLARPTVLLAPFVPVKADEVWSQLGGPGSVHEQRFDGLETLDVAGRKLRKGAPLFPNEAARPAP